MTDAVATEMPDDDDDSNGDFDGLSFIDWLAELGLQDEELSDRAMQSLRDAHRCQVIEPNRRSSQALNAALADSGDQGDDDDDGSDFMTWLDELGISPETHPDLTPEGMATLRRAYLARTATPSGNATLLGQADMSQFTRAMIAQSRIDLAAQIRARHGISLN